MFFHPSGNFFFQAGDGINWAAYNSSYAIGSTGWHHTVCSHDGSVHNLYVDGYLRSSNAGGSIVYNTTNVYLGYNPDLSIYYKAENDEINYFTRKLTDGGISVGQLAGGEVAELWNGGVGVELRPEILLLKTLGRGLSRGLGRGL